MNISRETIDALNSTLRVKIEKADYDDNVNKTLKDYRRKAHVPGFRPGMVPAGMIKKMYGHSILMDEVYRQMSDAMHSYIKDNNLQVLGEPIPNEQATAPNFDTQEDFEFVYDMAVAPEVKLEINNKISIPYYNIKIDEKEKQERIDGYLRYFGEFSDAESIELDDMVTVDVAQEGDKGHHVENALLGMKVIPEAKQKKLMGHKVGDTITLNVRKMLQNDADCAAFLKVTKEVLNTLEPEFTLTIKEIKRTQPAEMNQDLFDKVYGAGLITSETEFIAKIEAEIRTQLSQESNYRFLFDTRKHLIKLAKLDLPEKFLKRWLLLTSDGEYTQEQIDKDFPIFSDDLRWQIIGEHILKAQSIEVTEDDVVNQAKKIASQQLAMYGLNNLPDESITGFALNMLEKKGEHRRIHQQLVDEKIMDYVRSTVKVNTKEVSGEEFKKIFEAEAE